MSETTTTTTTANEATCPSCGDAAPLVAGSCARCGGQLMVASALVEAAARAGHSEEQLRQFVEVAPAADTICKGCQVPRRRVRARRFSADVCGRCGEGFVAKAAAQAAAVASTPRAMTELERGRWIAAPIVAIVASAVPPLAVRSHPLLMTNLALALGVVGLVTPAVAAFLVRLVVPSRKDAAAVVAAVACAAVCTFVGYQHGVAFPVVVASVTGVAFAVVAAASRATAVRTGVAAAVAVVAFVGGRGVVLKLDETARAGCPDGDRWTKGAGRYCARPDGTRDGPGEIRGVGDVLMEQGIWKMGKREGAFVLFHKNGQKRAEGLYADDAEEGPWLFFDDAGVVVESGRFRRGLREGPWQTYRGGEPHETVNYLHDKVTTKGL